MQRLDWNNPDIYKFMTPEERAFVDNLAAEPAAIWEPLPGPQTMAYESTADIVGYGGAAGGGKTDLACGAALTKHEKIMIFRRNGTELTAVLDRFEELLGTRDGYNGQDKIWRIPRRKVQVEFAGIPNLGDERKFRGRPHDLLVFDEASEFIVAQIRFLLTWLRSVNPKQRCQALLTFNPPTSAEGRWIIEFFAPWLDTKHPNPAVPGEIRWFAGINGKDVEVPDNRRFVLSENNEIVYTFDPTKFKPTDVITPLSRTFIPSRVSDNPYLYGTGYMSQLQQLPEPLRSQMLNGDFQAGMEDDQWQVIPTAWVDAAMARWKPLDRKPPMDSLGVDVARGGRDKTVLSPRHDNWYAPLLKFPGTATPDGPSVAGLVVANMRDKCPIHIDVIGVGSSPYDCLNEAGLPVIGVNVSEKALGTDKSGRLRFLNQRSELWWKFRETLDPANNTGIALPPDPELRADLCAPCWKLRGAIIQVESREEIVDRIGRSPDAASAVLLASIETPRVRDIEAMQERRGVYDPYAEIGVRTESRREYNPYDKLK